jgi:hypothetical protein
MKLFSNAPAMWNELIAEFFHNKWWTRAWIVQEVMLAKNPDVHRGTRGLSFELLLRLSSFMVKYALDPDLQNQLSAESLRSRTRHEMTLYRSRLKLGIRVSLGDWIAQFHNQEATNPRDLVYGFLGLAQSNVPTRITPQYELPLERVFAHGTLYIITQSKSLDFICLGRAPHRNSPEEVYKVATKEKVQVPVKLPSWVPDLRVRDGFGTILRRPLPLNYGAVDKGLNVINDALVQSIFNASALPFRGHADESSLTLRCFGVRVDTIADFANCLCLINEDFSHDYMHGSVAHRFVSDAEKLFHETALAKATSNSNVLPATVIQAYSQAYPVLSTQHTWLQAFNKTMMLDLHFDGSPLKPHEGFNNLAQTPPADFLPDEPVRQVRLNRWKLHLHADQYTWSAGRRFIATQKGYLGIANWDAKIGDVVCVLEGASVPFVMRKSTDAGNGLWEFVGET